MLKNYLKITLRSLWQQKTYSFINIFGLAVGLSSTILILLWVADEMSYDRFHQKEAHLFKAMNRGVFDGKLQCWHATPSLLGPALKKEFPEIVETTRMNWTSPKLLAVGEKRLHIDGAEVDPGFLTMFSFPLLQGDPQTALQGIQSIVIAESLAKKLFGRQNPMNRVIRLENRDNFTVKGVMKDLPKNTEFDFEFLISWEYLKKIGEDYAFWGNNSYKTYVETLPGTSAEAVNRKIRDITIRNSQKEEDTEVFLHSIQNWRLYSEFENGKISGGRIEYVHLFSIIAAFILLIACINFMNLATARSEKRIKEVGIRKTIGAARSSLILQFLGESTLVAAFALVLAVVITELVLPSFNLLTEKQLFIQYTNPLFWVIALFFILFTGLLAGSYPAFYLSSFQPVKVLKGTYLAGRSAVLPRKILVVVQFTFSISLIISTIVIYQQIQYAKNRLNGYEKESLVFHFFTGDIAKNFELIKAELIDKGIATAACKTNHPITSANSNTWGVHWEGKNPKEKILFEQMTADVDFAKTMGIQLSEGRDLDLKTFKTDSSACLMNETAIKTMRMKDPIGKSVDYEGNRYRIVGVVKDFIWGSPYAPIRPMFVRAENWFQVITIRLNKHLKTEEAMKKAAKVFEKYNPYYPFEPRFVDAEYARKFKNEQLIGTLSNLFAFLTVIISCLGLFGLAAYTAELRTKEIGIRKVLGARVVGIVVLLSKDFLRLVIIAFLIASPLTWWLMQQWLEDYTYRVEISWWIFALAGLLSVLIALLTVSYQAVRASMTNPVHALRYE
ncbi:MAG: ABC transporter permease [Microscillaceae bacterium]|nr:ABC transporter permease [Microscillaceae bacterium]